MKFAISLICLVVTTCIITWLLSVVIRSRNLVILSAVVVTELTVLLFQYTGINQSYDPHMAEILYLPFYLLIISMPIVAGTAWGVMALKSKLEKCRATKNK
jgi:hypothetical protein